MKKNSLLLFTIAVVSVIVSCGKNDNSQISPIPEPVYNLNTDTTLAQYMVWWGGFNSIKMPLDSIPDGTNTVHLFLIDLDARPEVALDTTHITMQEGVSWQSILEASHRLQKRGIKVVATIMAQRYRTTDTIPPYSKSHGIPPAVNNQSVSLGSITDPETFAATVKRKVIDEWKLDGIDLDCEEEIGQYGVYNQTYDKDGKAEIDHGNISRATAVFKELAKYFGPKSGSGKLFIIDRGRKPMEIIPATYQYLDRIIFQAYNWNTSGVQQAYDNNKAYFSPDQMHFTLNAQRARSGWDEDTDLVPNGFTQYGDKERAVKIATDFAKIKLPGQSKTINMGIYQVAGDWTLGFPITRAIFEVQGKKDVLKASQHGVMSSDSLKD